MENKMRLSKAVKEAYRSSIGKRLSVRYFVSNIELIHAVDPDRYIESIKQDMSISLAKEIQTRLELTSTPDHEKDGFSIRGECYVFTHDELLELMNDLENKVIEDHRPQTIWGD